MKTGHNCIDRCIHTWLSSIPSIPPSFQREDYQTLNARTSPSSIAIQSHKRILPTPPMSSEEGPASKRACHDRDATDEEPQTAQSVTHSDLSCSSTASAVSQLKRTRSRKASAAKGLTCLQIEHIVTRISFGGIQSPPKSLDELYSCIERYSTGTGIISSNDIELIRARSLLSPLFNNMLRAPELVDTTGHRERLGKLPDLDTLMRIWADAEECEREGHSEAAWNCAVHFPLLRSSLPLAKVNQPDSQARQRFGVKVVNVTTAQVAKPYVTQSIPANHDRRVDFCLCIKPDPNSTLSTDIYHIGAGYSHGSINHTDYVPIMNSPIVLSIETKRTAGDEEMAFEQLSTWMASQWTRLRELAGTSYSDEKMLEFLPGVVVEGHD